MWPSTPAERRHLAYRCRTCCLRRFRASRPPQSYFFRGSIPHPIRSLCTLRIRRRRRLRNTRFPAVRYRLTGAGLSPAGSRQLRLTHRNRKFESISLQQRVTCEPDFRHASLANQMLGSESWPGLRDQTSATPSLEVARIEALCGNRGHVEMAVSLMSTRLLEVISTLCAGNAQSGGEPPFPDVQCHFHGHAGMAPSEWTSQEARRA